EFIESAKQVVQDDLRAEIYGKTGHHRHIWGSWLNFRSLIQPIPALACALLVFALGFSTYQNRVTIAELKTQAAAAQSQGTLTAQVVTSDPVRLSEARRGDEHPISVSKNNPISLQFDVPPGNSAFYDAVVTTESGTKKLSLRRI